MTVSLQQKNKMSKNGKTSKDFFLSRDAIRLCYTAKTAQSPGVCLSVRPSVRYVRVLYRDG